ncbi:MAG: hypothetical protein ACLP8B_14655 [Xanthobacteraceae bacterium]
MIDLDRATTLEAARLSLQHRIAMADSIMLATAHRHRATRRLTAPAWRRAASTLRDG